MKIPILLAILLLTSSVADACSGNEVSRTCECTAMYTAGEYDLVDSMGVSTVDESNLKRLFTVKSYDDCGINLGCETSKQNDCARYCTSQIIEKLASASVINELAKASLCQLVMGEEPLFENGLRLFAHWKYSSCKSGYNVIVKNVCCNRVCDCKLLKSTVSGGVESLIYAESVKQKAFQCDKASDDPCLAECRSKMAAYVRDPALASTSSVSLNLFANQATANHVCRLLQPEAIASPGVNIVVRAETNRYKYANYIHLGQLCCYGDEICKCALALRGFDTTGAQSLKARVLEYSLAATANKGYQCHAELRSCMKECRNGMLPPAYDSVQMTSDLYPLDTQLAIQVCSSLQTDLFPTAKPEDLENEYKNGIDVFIEFNQDKAFPEHEQLFLGRVCCRNSPNGLTPSIRCV